MGWIASDAVRKAVAAQIRDIDAPARTIVGPAMIAAFERVSLHLPEPQRHLTVGAAVLEREEAAARTAIEYYWLAAESYAERFSRFDFVRPGDRIPEIGVRIDSAKVDLGVAGSAILHRAGCAPGAMFQTVWPQHGSKLQGEQCAGGKTRYDVSEARLSAVHSTELEIADREAADSKLARVGASHCDAAYHESPDRDSCKRKKSDGKGADRESRDRRGAGQARLGRGRRRPNRPLGLVGLIHIIHC